MNRLLGWALTFRLWRSLWGRIPGHPLLAIPQAVEARIMKDLPDYF